MEKVWILFEEFLWKLVWKMICNGKTSPVLCDEIYDVYGHCTSVLKNLKLIQRDHMDWGNPALTCNWFFHFKKEIILMRIKYYGHCWPDNTIACCPSEFSIAHITVLTLVRFCFSNLKIMWVRVLPLQLSHPSMGLWWPHEYIKLKYCHNILILTYGNFVGHRHQLELLLKHQILAHLMFKITKSIISINGNEYSVVSMKTKLTRYIHHWQVK